MSLFTAVEQQNLEEVKRLIASGADVNMKGNYSCTPLRNAIVTNQFDIAKFLVENGADVNPDVMNPLCIAVEVNNTEFVKYFVKNGADVNKKNSDGKSALMYAVQNQNQNIDIIKILVEKGADVNARDKDGRNVLNQPVKTKNLEIVKFLLKKGADREEALGYAIQYNCWEIASFLISYKKLTLFDYVLKNDLDGVKTVLKDKKIDVNQEDLNGKTALIYALEKGSIEIAEYLMSKGAVMFDHKKRSEINMFLSSVRIGDVNLMKDVIERFNIDINAKNKDGNTALFIALENKKFDAVKFLFETGANINVQKGGKQFIEHVVETKNEDIIDFFTRREDINIFEKVNPTTLMVSSIKNKNEFLIRYMIEKKILSKDQKFKNKSLMFYALNTKNFDIVKLIGGYFSFTKRTYIDITKSYDSACPLIVVIIKSKNIEFIKYILGRFSIDYTTPIWESKSIKDYIRESENIDLIEFVCEKIFSRCDSKNSVECSVCHEVIELDGSERADFIHEECL